MRLLTRAPQASAKFGICEFSARTERIRVAFVMHKMQVAGAEVLVAEIMRRLAEVVDSTVICLDGIGALGEQLQFEGFRVMSLDRRPGIDWSLPPKLAEIVRGRLVDVIHAHQYTPFFYSALARTRCRTTTPIVFTEHGRHYPDVVSWKRRLANRAWLGRMSHATTACCQFAADAVRSKEGFSGGSIQVIPNGIDVSRFNVHESGERQRLRDVLGLKQDRKYVVTPARFHPVKDHSTLIEAFALVALEQSDATLLLLGDGPERHAIERLVDKLGLTGRVEFWGVRADVDSILAAADIFALSSLSEAASVTILEAMASGLPIVATAVGGTPELVRHNVEGLLSPRQDTSALASSISQLLRDPQLASKMGKAGRKRVLDEYQLDQTVDAYLAIYRRLAGVTLAQA